MAHIAGDSAAVGTTDSKGHDLDEESAKEGTRVTVTSESGEQKIAHRASSVKYLSSVNNPVAGARDVLEDTSVKKKKRPKNRKEFGSAKHKGSSDIKVVVNENRAASVAIDELVEGCASLNLATKMELVNSDSTYYMRPGSPYVSSENEWEASDSDADHSDSSDDDNPKSQVDRWIDYGAIQYMDGENSNLSSETDDTDDDSDSDITDVSPLVSTGTSPLFGLSPAVSRRNLLSGITNRPPPFMRHYSHKGHDGDDEDEDDNQSDFNKWSNDLVLNNETTDSFNNQQYDNSHEPNMSLVVQALLNLELDRTEKTDNDQILESSNENNNHLKQEDDHNRFSEMIRRHSHISNPIHANPHHKHLRKQHSHPRRKNMSFTNEEVRIINRDNTIMLDKLLAVHNRAQKHSTKPHSNKPATSSINRKRMNQETDRENLALFRRLQEVKPSKEVSTSSPRSKTSTPPRSCSAVARRSTSSFSHLHHPHRSHTHHRHGKESALL